MTTNRNLGSAGTRRQGSIGLLATILLAMGCQAATGEDAGGRREAARAVPVPTSVAPATVAEQVMREHYGARFDTRHQCWQYTPATEADLGGPYCMKLRAVEPVLVGGKRMLHVLAVSEMDWTGEGSVSAGRAEPGLMGAFLLDLSASPWRYVAQSPALPFGSFGACGCEQARLVKIGEERHAWTFTTGGVWQGIVVSWHHIVAPLDGKFQDVSGIPEITEEAQDARYEWQPIATHGQAWYPLLVTKKRDGGATESKRIQYDPEKATYLLPAGW